jgi:hypothetical protein
MEVLSPLGVAAPRPRSLARRPADLAGRRVGILDNLQIDAGGEPVAASRAR